MYVQCRACLLCVRRDLSLYADDEDDDDEPMDTMDGEQRPKLIRQCKYYYKYNIIINLSILHGNP